MARELKRDLQLENLMREPGHEFGIAAGSRLDRVLQAQDLDQALRREINITHGLGVIAGIAWGVGRHE